MPSVSELPRSADLYPNSSCRQFCLFGTQPLHLADHIAVAGLRRENVEAFRASRGRRGAAWRAFRELLAGGVGADPENPFRSTSSFREAGLDGFWLHRVLQSEGVESHVQSIPSSIATSRRRRRAKTDRIDGEALLRALLAWREARRTSGVRDGESADARGRKIGAASAASAKC